MSIRPTRRNGSVGRGRVDFVAQASLTAMTKSFEWPAAFCESEALGAWHARFPIRRTTSKQASRQAGDPMGTRSSTITTGIMRAGHESQAKLVGWVGWRHPFELNHVLLLPAAVCISNSEWSGANMNCLRLLLLCVCAMVVLGGAVAG